MKLIKFDLPIDGIKAKNIEDLRDHFTTEVMDHFQSGLLVKWLASRKLQSELEAVKALDDLEDQALLKSLCEIFGIEADDAVIAEVFRQKEKNSITTGVSLNDYEPLSTEILGIVPAQGFITGIGLAKAIGLTAGEDKNSECGWIHYRFNGKERYVSIKPVRYSLSWEDIYNVGAIDGSNQEGITWGMTPRRQDATVEINGVRYLVKLMKGSTETYDWFEHSDPLDPADQSEWGQIIGRVLGHVDSVIDALSEEDLKGTPLFEPNDWCWCQETTRDQDSGTRLLRGGRLYSDKTSFGRDFAQKHIGWRPVLERLGQ